MTQTLVRQSEAKGRRDRHISTLLTPVEADELDRIVDAELSTRSSVTRRALRFYFEKVRGSDNDPSSDQR